MADPAIKAIGDALVAYWSTPDLLFHFDKLTDHRDGLTAELTVTNGSVESSYWGKITLASPQSRQAVLRTLEERHPIEGWRRMLDRSCQLVAQQFRQGEPEAPMVATPPAADRWLVPGLIPLHETTIVYADGGSGKSLFALALALSGLTGHALGGPWRVAPLSRVLYLDWESTRQAHEGRLWGLTRHGEQPAEQAILHRRLWHPLVDEIATVRTVVAKSGAELVICDSLAPAAGVDPESANASTSTFNALASLSSTTRLVLAHVSKASMEGGRTAPYGSVFNRNLARSAIEIRPTEAEDESELTITLYHKKMNEGRKQSPSALTFTFGPDGAIDVRRGEPDQAGASVATQILASLRGGKQTVSTLAEETGLDKATIRMTLNREAAKGNRSKVIRFDSVSGGRGKESEWGLRDTNRISRDA